MWSERSVRVNQFSKEAIKFYTVSPSLSPLNGSGMGIFTDGGNPCLSLLAKAADNFTIYRCISRNSDQVGAGSALASPGRGGGGSVLMVDCELTEI